MMAMFGRDARLIRLAVVCGLIGVLVGAAVPASARAQEATPTAAASGSLAAMLRLVPDVVSGAAQPPVQIASYADLAAQTAATGVPLPTSKDDPNFAPWAFALSPLMVPDPLFTNAMVADWHTLLGIDLWQIDQALQVGEPPSTLTFLRGRFDATAIRAAWASQGYKMLQVDGIAVASLHEDASFDLSTDLGRLAFTHFNNAAILPDGTLAYAPTLDAMRAIIAVVHGSASSLADRVDVAALVRAITKPLASALLMAGTALQVDVAGALLAATPDVGAMKTQVAEVARMPPILMALLGVTAGGPLAQPPGGVATPRAGIPPARFEIAVLLPDHAAAETAAKVATERLATGASLATRQPLTHYFASWNARALPNSPVAVLELEFAMEVQPRIWAQMIYQRDLVFLAW